MKTLESVRTTLLLERKLSENKDKDWQRTGGLPPPSPPHPPQLLLSAGERASEEQVGVDEIGNGDRVGPVRRPR